MLKMNLVRAFQKPKQGEYIGVIQWLVHFTGKSLKRSGYLSTNGGFVISFVRKKNSILCTGVLSATKSVIGRYSSSVSKSPFGGGIK